MRQIMSSWVNMLILISFCQLLRQRQHLPSGIVQDVLQELGPVCDLIFIFLSFSVQPFVPKGGLQVLYGLCSAPDLSISCMAIAAVSNISILFHMRKKIATTTFLHLFISKFVSLSVLLFNQSSTKFFRLRNQSP